MVVADLRSSCPERPCRDRSRSNGDNAACGRTASLAEAMDVLALALGYQSPAHAFVGASLPPVKTANVEMQRKYYSATEVLFFVFFFIIIHHMIIVFYYLSIIL